MIPAWRFRVGADLQELFGELLRFARVPIRAEDLRSGSLSRPGRTDVLEVMLGFEHRAADELVVEGRDAGVSSYFPSISLELAVAMTYACRPTASAWHPYT